MLEEIDVTSSYAGDDWGYGQIMGIVIFAPVLVEMGFAAWKVIGLSR